MVVALIGMIIFYVNHTRYIIGRITIITKSAPSHFIITCTNCYIPVSPHYPHHQPFLFSIILHQSVEDLDVYREEINN